MSSPHRKSAEFLKRLLANLSAPFYLSYRFIALGELITKLNDPRYKLQVGLGIKELRILRFVQFQPGQAVSMIGRWTFTEKAMMSRLVTRLCDLGYLERRIGSSDARSMELYVTEAGVEMIAKADAAAEELFRRQFPSVTPQQCRALMETLDAMLLESVSASGTQMDGAELDELALDEHAPQAHGGQHKSS